MSLAVRTTEEVQAAESRAFALDALDAIARVKTPEEAESLLGRVKVAAEAARVMHLGKNLAREWRGIEIKAERKWGELLGAANNRGPATVSRTNSSAERVAQHEARKLAAVPEPVFEEYVEQVEAPTKAGLLRAAEQAAPTDSTELASTSAHDLTRRQRDLANAARDRVDNGMNALKGLCIGIDDVDVARATTTATEEQVSRWLQTAEQASKTLRQFAKQLREAPC